MSNFGIILKALFRNKLRFDDGKKKSKKLVFALLLGAVYFFVMFAFIAVIVELKDIFLDFPFLTQSFYFFVLLTAALIVLIFGIIHLISVLYLSKDTDFYSMLPVKPATVFSAKLAYVYLSETAIVVAVALPLLIALGIVAKLWAWYYVITIATMLIVPVFPLVMAAIVAVPVMLLASKLKNRNIISLAFYMVLFGGAFGFYIYFVYIISSGAVTSEEMAAMLNAIQAVINVFYPYSVLSAVACGIPLYGLGLGASTVVGLVIFVAISAALVVVIWFLSKYMYARSVKANNQTDNSKAKKGEFKSASGMRALIRREYVSSMRTTQTAFQCYAVMLLPIFVAVVFGLMTRNIVDVEYDETLVAFYGSFVRLLAYCTMCAMFATLGNAASSTFSREGNAMASLKILPVDIKTIFRAKIVAWIIIAVPAATVAIVVLSVMNFAWQDFLLALFSLVPISVVFIIFGALWDLTAPKLKWTDPMQAIKHNMHVLGGQMIMMASGLGVLIIIMILMSATAIDFSIIYAICWTLLYAVLAVFAVVDILMYRKIETYYNRIEM